MSAFKWLRFTVGMVILSVLLAFIYSFTNPAIPLLREYSTSSVSATGIDWYEQWLGLLPLMTLLLLAFMLIVGIVLRRRSVVQ